MLTRRTVITGALAASAGFRSFARAQNPPASGPAGDAAPRTILQLQRRNIVVNGSRLPSMASASRTGRLASGPMSISRFAFEWKTGSTSRA
jgi:hypothetical protein